MSGWHLHDDLATAYVDGTLDDPRAFSVEAHLLSCVACRQRIASVFDSGQLDELWVGIVAEIDAPRPTPVERLLLRAGVDEHIARLLAAVPSLTLSWIGAVAVALGFAVLAAHVGASDRWLLVFLAVAPLVPVAGVAAAYGPGLDPGYEIGVAASLSGWRLLLLRTTAVLTASVVLAGLAALAVPASGWLMVAWLLPALAATLFTVALGTLIEPRWAALAVAWVWLTIVSTAARTLTSPLELFGAPIQLASAVLTAVALGVALWRHDAYDTA